MAHSRSLRILQATFLLAWCAWGTAHAVSIASDLYNKTRKAVFQVQVINLDTQTKSTLGSGFFVTADGFAISNFHVVSDFVHRPEKYTIRLETDDKQIFPLTLVAVDVINDLAVLKAEHTPAHFLDWGDSEALIKGDRMYSLGNPENLGPTIVEGSFSGSIEKSLYDRIHFTGSLNSGVSGGPTIDAKARVVGINVAASGDQVSFLIKEKYARKLLQQAMAAPIAQPDDFKSAIRDQLNVAQELVTTRLVDASFETSALGPFRVPGELLPQIECWGDNWEADSTLYDVATKTCSSRGYIYLSGRHFVKPIYYSFDYVRARDLNQWASARLFKNHFADLESSSYVTEQDVTNFQCKTMHLKHGEINYRVAYCLRALKKYDGLYDFSFRLASLHSDSESLLGEIVAGGVSKNNAARLARRFIESIQWKP